MLFVVIEYLWNDTGHKHVEHVWGLYKTEQKAWSVEQHICEDLKDRGHAMTYKLEKAGIDEDT